MFVLASALLVGVLGHAGVSAQGATAAFATAYGVEVKGPVGVTARPAVEAQVPPESESHAEDSLIEVPADPAATSFTAHVEADATRAAGVDAILQGTIEGASGVAPLAKWNARGYAITEDLRAVAGQVGADVIEAEAVAGCEAGKLVVATAARVVNLRVGTNSVGITANPNTVVFNQGGIRVVFWETNWDPATGTTTDGERPFVNALRITGPQGVDVAVSHAEASANCAAAKRPGPGPGPKGPGPEGPQPAPPAQPVPAAPGFTG